MSRGPRGGIDSTQWAIDAYNVSFGDETPDVILRDELPDLLPHADVIYSSPTVAAELPGQDDGVVLDRRLLDTYANDHAVVASATEAGRTGERCGRWRRRP